MSISPVTPQCIPGRFDMRSALIIVNLGGPSGINEVRPFLKELFSDPDIFRLPGGKAGQAAFSSLISSLRYRHSASLYRRIGGSSPITENTRLQAEALADALSDCPDLQVFHAQRYSRPFLRDLAADLQEKEFEKIILLPLFPQYSTTTTLSVINEWKRCAGALYDKTRFIQRFFSEQGFIRAFADRIREKSSLFQAQPFLLFTAHSIPLSRVQSGDPYQHEIQETVGLILKELHFSSGSLLSYQSRVGPVKWLEPSVESALHTLKKDGVKDLLIVPVSFVSEHLETLYELDIEYRDLAHSLGFRQYERASVPGLHSEFIHALAVSVRRAADH